MPKPEAMTAENFDEDDYRTNLIDKEGYSEETAKMKAKKMKESFEAKKIEIDLSSLAKAKDDDEYEHLPSEERKKRQKDRDERQKKSALYRADRKKQHDEVESSIPAGE